MSILVTAPPKTPCVRCSQSHDTPAAFLMACFKCKRAWHHRCHIPPVTEKEIIDRINADEQGKHDAGLAAWQCRVCSKKRRVEDISADGTASRDNTSKIARSQAADGTNLHELKASASNPTDTTPPVVPAKSASNALPSNVVVIDIDDDVDIVEVVPRPGAMNQTQVAQPVMPTEKKPPEVNRHVDNSSLESSVAAGRPPPKPTFRDHVRHKGNGGRVIPSQIAQSQGRSARDTFVITPLAPPGHSRKQASSQSSRGGNSTSVHAAETGSVSEPSPSAPRPRKETSTVSTKDIRELISSLRAKGKLEPPPQIDYVLSRPSSSRQPPSRPAASRNNSHFVQRSETRDLDEVERKLDDFGDEDSMDVDPPDPVPEEQQEPPDADPHNIDDLYGDVAPQYRNGPPPPPAARGNPSASSLNHLLWAIQEKRLLRREGASAAPVREPAPEGLEDAPRRPRKGAAKRLQGKELRRKQAMGLDFAVGEVDWRASGQ